jgi:cobalt-zinc-cadmium efflux system protein
MTHGAHDRSHGGHVHGGHAHGHAPKHFGAAFAIGTALNLALVLAEIGFGFLSNSLALISDGIHNCSDVLGLLLAWGAQWLGSRQPTAERTYGYRRASILAALANATLLLIATGAIVIEAVRRFLEAQPVESTTVLWVAAFAIVVNTATALLFMGGRKHDINIGGAFLHMAGDALVSAGVLVSALLIRWTGWMWLDPAVSIAVAVVIVAATWGLTREAFNMALDAVPSDIDRDAVETYLAGLPGVTDVHDLHIWAMSTTETALTAHLVRPGAGLDDDLLTQAAHDLEHRFGIRHVTVQVECGETPCRLASAKVV